MASAGFESSPVHASSIALVLIEGVIAVTYGFSFHNACDVAANAAFLSAGISFGWYLLKSLTNKVADKL